MVLTSVRFLCHLRCYLYSSWVYATWGQSVIWVNGLCVSSILSVFDIQLRWDSHMQSPGMSPSLYKQLYCVAFLNLSHVLSDALRPSTTSTKSWSFGQKQHTKMHAYSLRWKRQSVGLVTPFCHTFPWLYLYPGPTEDNAKRNWFTLPSWVQSTSDPKKFLSEYEFLLAAATSTSQGVA